MRFGRKQIGELPKKFRKRCFSVVWTAFSRSLGKIVAFVIGVERDCAYKLFRKAQQVVGKISLVYTDPNSCYEESFKANGVAVRHIVTDFKNDTHMIEATNSSLRDNLARFNRITKRYTKSLEILECTLKLFCHLKQFNTF